MAALTVKAPLIVVKSDDGAQHYLRRGAQLPDWVDKDHVKQLRDAGMVEAAKAPAKKAASSKQSAKSGEDGKGDGSQADGESDPFDPSKHNQDDVLEHLATAEPDEVARVKAAEAEGKNRDKIAAFEPVDD